MNAAPARSLKVLVVEDNDADADLMCIELRRTQLVGATVRVQTEQEFYDRVREGPDAIVSDYTLPAFSAPRALEICRELNLDIPFIVVTGSISEEVAVDCMKRGAADYLLKDRLARLGSALEQAVNAKSIRDQKSRAERSRDAAMRELDHRVRNNLGVIVGLADLTARSVETLAGFTPAFMGRVRALATVHDALGERHWLSVDLASLVIRVVQQQTALTRDRLHVEGEPVAVAAHAVQPLGLVVHELARNAALHGAWSVPQGRVRLAWTRGPEGMARLHWEETGGPAPPESASRGAGLSLVQNLVTHELHGKLLLEFPPTGVRADITCRVARPDDEIEGV